MGRAYNAGRRDVQHRHIAHVHTEVNVARYGWASNEVDMGQATGDRDGMCDVGRTQDAGRRDARHGCITHMWVTHVMS